MSSLSVTASITSADPPPLAFERFAQGRLLDLECTSLTVGSAVSLNLPVGGEGIAGMPITLLGRVASVRWGRSVVIAHYQPWRGRLTIRFIANSDGGTRVAIESSVDSDGIAWLAHKRGFSPPEALRPDRHRIGLLVSKSGPAAVFTQATESLAQLAVDEINDAGGIEGQLVELIIGDDASAPVAGAAAANRLARSGCRTVFACVTSATFNAAAAVLNGTDTLLVHSILNEGGIDRPGLVRLGERPLDQVRAGIPALMAETGSSRWFFVGHRYSWSFGAHWAARRVVAEQHGTVLGDSYLPLGTRDFSTTVAAIAASGADLILSSLVGQDEVTFEKQSARAGLRARTRTLALVLDEATHQLIGPDAAEGLWAVSGYFQGAVDSLREVEQRYYREQDMPTPPMTALSEATYEAILQYGHAMQAEPDLDREGLRSRFASAIPESRGELHRPILIAESRGGVLRLR